MRLSSSLTITTLLLFGSLLSPLGAHAAWGDLGIDSAIGDIAAIDAYGSDFAVMVAADGAIRVSSDNGVTWSASTSGTTADLYDVDVVSATNAIVVGNAGIWKTTNSGTSWSRVKTSLGVAFTAVSMASSSTGMVVDDNGNIWKTTNSGTSWSRVHSGSTNSYTGVHCASLSTCAAAGTGVFGSMVALTTDGGSNWSTEYLTSASSLTDIHMMSATRGIAVGDGAWVTTDGATWTAVTLPTEATGDTVAAIDMTSSTTGLMITDADVLITEDGTTWTTLTTFTDAGALADVDATLSVVVGADATARRSDDDAPGAPENLVMVDGEATADTTPTFTWDAAVDATTPIDHYMIYESPTWYDIGDVTSYTVPSANARVDQVYAFQIYAVDRAGNNGYSSTITYIVDTLVPTIDNFAINATTTGATTTFTATVDDTSVSSSFEVTCTAYVNGATVGSGTFDNSAVTIAASVTTAGSYSGSLTCTDLAGNTTTSDSIAFTVSTTSSADSSTSEDDEVVDDASAGALIKLACGTGADVNDPCRAVYYYGEDGKRHAFPNEKVYFTWYSDFDDVVIVTDTFMASLMLGKNVTYHPGTKMVKFITVNTVYAVGEQGELRAIASEDIAHSLYGSTWNKQIDDISDAFFGNYSFGEDIDSTSDYDPDEVAASVDTIDDIL